VNDQVHRVHPIKQLGLTPVIPTTQMNHVIMIIGIFGINVWFMPDLPW
jgi:hypothetical protein